MAVPIRVLWNLRISLLEKLSLGFVFVVGIITMVTAIVRSVSLESSSGGGQVSTTWLILVCITHTMHSVLAYPGTSDGMAHAVLIYHMYLAKIEPTLTYYFLVGWYRRSCGYVCQSLPFYSYPIEVK